MSGRVDSHCHLWELKRGDYGWLDPADPGLAPIARDYLMGDLDAVTRPHDVAQVVAVQAAPTVAETRYLLDIAASTPVIAGVVGWVDLTDAAAAADLHSLHEAPAFKGIRPMLQDIADVDWITTAPRADALSALSDLGLRFDALVLPQHLGPFLTFAVSHPDLPVVIDHAAKPAFAAPSDDPRHDLWRTGMQRLAQETHALCKISGLLTEMSPEQRTEPLTFLQPVIDDLLDWFGPDRLMWGSDWPVVTLAAGYPDWVALAEELLSALSAQDRTQIFGGTARRFYDLEAAA